MEQEVKQEKITKGFVILSMSYLFLLLLANIMALKMLKIGPFVTQSGVLVFPLVYIISDIITECYGLRLSMLSIRINTACCLVFAIATQILIILPYPDFWQNQSAMASVFGATPRIVLASLIAYYIGNWSNSSILSFMKVKVNKWGFEARAIISTIIGEGFDTSLFLLIAFYGVVPNNMLLTMITSQYIFKTLYEIVFIPLTSKVVNFWKKWDNADYIDTLSKELYNPFSL